VGEFAFEFSLTLDIRSQRRSQFIDRRGDASEFSSA
jgi:hypothetical protein